jgi:hypothetical protein
MKQAATPLYKKKKIGRGCVGAQPEGFYINMSQQWIIYVGKCK